jgi:PAS domain S-box-containing protein
MIPRLEKALRASEDRSRLLFEHALDVIITIDLDGRITSWNPKAETLFGWSQDEVLGRLLSDTIIPPAYREAHERGLAHYRTTGEGPMLNRQLELTALRRDGSELPVELAITPLRIGGTTIFGAFLRDITERRRVEQALQDSEASFRLLFSSNPLPMWVFDVATLEFLEVNDAAVAQYGYTRAEFLRMRIADIRPPEDVARLEAVRHRLKDGRVRDVEIVSHSLDFARRRAALVVVIDVTEVKQSQQALGKSADAKREADRANQSKSTFLANMSHELRSPLNGIIGFAELMHDGRVGPVSCEHKEYLGDILTSAHHLLELINDVLDLAKVESGKMEIRPEPTDPARTVAEVRDTLRPLAAQKRIEVSVDVAPDVGVVTTDPAKLKQVLYNYVSNALKFTPDKGRVIIRVRRVSGEKEFLVEVEDTGPGIRAEDLGRLFVEFQQLEATDGKKHAGTGLGLALTKRIVERQGGHVGVRSTPGVGSLFFAVLPCHSL